MENNDNLPATTNQNEVVKPDEVVDTPSDNAMQVVMNYVKRESRSDKIKLLNALDAADNKLADCVGQTLTIAGVYAETHYSVKKQKQVCRVLLIDADGKSYATGSFVFMNSLKNIIDILGDPTTIDEPIKIQIADRPMEKGNAIIAKVVE